MKKCKFDHEGREIVDPVPFQPTGIRPKSMSLHERMKRMIKQQLSIQAAENGQETWEESQDLDIPDEFDRELDSTKYEILDDFPLNTAGDPEAVEPEDPEPQNDEPDEIVDKDDKKSDNAIASLDVQ